MDHEPVAVAYYRGVTGAWDGTAHLSVRSWPAFWRASLPLVDRVRLLGMVAMQAALGPPRLQTEVVPEAPLATTRRVRHEMTMSRAGQVLYRATRWFEIGEDGATVSATGTEAIWPWLDAPRPLPPGTATITDPLGSTYDLSAQGVIWRVTFARAGEVAHAVVTCPWGVGEERLKRVPGTAEGAPDTAPG